MISKGLREHKWLWSDQAGRSIHEHQHRKRIATSEFGYWGEFHRLRGECCYAEKRRCPDELKGDVVTVAFQGDLMVLDAATDFGAAEETVRRWMRQADIRGGNADGVTGSE